MDSKARRLLASVLAAAERNYRLAQDAVAEDASDEARARYASAIADYDRLQRLMPAVAGLLEPAPKEDEVPQPTTWLPSRARG